MVLSRIFKSPVNLLHPSKAPLPINRIFSPKVKPPSKGIPLKASWFTYPTLSGISKLPVNLHPLLELKNPANA